MYSRIIFIFWRWDDISSKKWDIFPIEDQNDALIIRIKEEEYPELILKEVEHQIGSLENAKVIWLIHRTKFKQLFSKINSTTLYKRTRILNKTYQFSGGKGDKIYYDGYESGLIATGYNRFYADVQEILIKTANGEKSKFVTISVLTEQNDKVQLKYFDNTWNYYEHNFKTRITDLFNAISDHFIEIPNSGWNNQVHTADIWQKKLKKNKILHLRIKSFLDVYNQENLEKNEFSNELKTLNQIENEQNTSYIFDNCPLNITQGQLEYKELHKFLYPLFIKPNSEVQAKWETIEHLFQKLLTKLK